MDFASIGSNSYINQMSSVSSIASTTSLSSSSYESAVQSTPSYDTVEISAEGRGRQQPPDFESMSTDEFRSHLEEIQAKMSADGVTSDLPDVSTLSDSELEELKTEMASKGAGGGQRPEGPPPPPKGADGPPPPPPSGAIEEEEDELLDQLLAALEESEETTTDTSSVDELVNSAAFQQLVSEYSINN